MSCLLVVGILIKISIKHKHFRRPMVQCQTNLFSHRQTDISLCHLQMAQLKKTAPPKPATNK